MTNEPQPPSDAPDDPVLQSRERIRRLANTGQRIGYILYGIAMLVFFIGLFSDFTPTMATVTVGALIAGSLVLAPAILLGYAVKAAEKEERGQS